MMATSDLEQRKQEAKKDPRKNAMLLATYEVQKDKEGLFVEMRGKVYRPGAVKHAAEQLNMSDGGYREGDHVVSYGWASVDNEGYGYDKICAFAENKWEHPKRVHWHQEGKERDALLVETPTDVSFDRDGRAHQRIKKDKEGLYIEVPEWRELNPEMNFPVKHFGRSLAHMKKYRPGPMKGLYEDRDMSERGVREGDQIKGLTLLGLDSPGSGVIAPTVTHEGENIGTITDPKTKQRLIDARFMEFETVSGKTLNWHMEGKARSALLEKNPKEIKYGEDGKAVSSQESGKLAEARKKMHKAAHQMMGQHYRGYGMGF